MQKFGFRVELKAKPGKEAEIEAFLKHAAVMAQAEAGVVTWQSFRQDDKPGIFGILDTFEDEIGRDAHATGELAKALFAKADELFSEPPTIHSLHIISNR